ncbi:putative skeletal organic matrix protein 5 [Oculina patagonica]
MLDVDSQLTSVLCHFGDFGCGDGGWTPVMKVDGSKSTFHYNSGYWSEQNEFNLPGGETGFDTHETKLPTYWNTSFSKICLGMKISQQINFIVINKQANSLYSLIADGEYRATSLGRDTWKTLIGSQAYLQPNCNKEGFNAASGDTTLGKARIGYLGNNENDCYQCDSRIGFGTGGRHDDTNTCGNEGGGSHIKTMGYILVQ